MKLLVPASSANLGPGFDCLGIAWNLYNEITFTPSDRLIITGCEEKFANEGNLAYQAYKKTMLFADADVTPVHIDFGKTDIPVSRGLGSSAALINAGVVAANVIGKIGMDKPELLRIGTLIEGHPDNVAPSLIGGMTVSISADHMVISEQYPINEKWHFTVVIPDFRLSTKAAREILPSSLSYSDAIFNVSHTALLMRAFENGDRELMRVAMDDKFHQPYRKALIGGYAATESAAKRLGADSVCISGAGPTILCVSQIPDFGDKLREEMKTLYPNWKINDVTPCNDGVTIVE